MGAGKTTIARALGLPHVETDADVPIELFDEGEPAFRTREAEVARDVLERSEPVVVDLGGGAVTTQEVRALLEEHATVVWIDVDVDVAWQRVEGSDLERARMAYSTSAQRDANLGFLFDPKLHPVAFAFTSSFDIFAIWSLILYIIGFSAISRLSRGKTAAVILVLWVVVVMLTLIGPAFQAAKMK